MATLPALQSARDLTLGLVGAGVLVAVVLAGPAGAASASVLADIPAFEDPAPAPPTDPAPNMDVPTNRGPTNYEGPPVHHRRHIGDPVR
jgi:hypothetical protein